MLVDTLDYTCSEQSMSMSGITLRLCILKLCNSYSHRCRSSCNCVGVSEEWVVTEAVGRGTSLWSEYPIVSPISIRNAYAMAISETQKNGVEEMSVQDRDRVARRKYVYCRSPGGHIHCGRAYRA